MLDIFGGEDWTPGLNHSGLFQRGGHESLGDLSMGSGGGGEVGDGNFVESTVFSFDEVLCGSPLGAPPTRT